MPDQEILNIDDAAAFLGVSVKTFSKVLREEDVPGRKVGREWKFSRRALIAWIGSASTRDFLEAGETPPPGRSRVRRRRSSTRIPRVNDGFSVDDL